MTNALFLILGLAVGAALGYLIASRRSTALQSQLSLQEQQVEDLKRSYEARLAELHQQAHQEAQRTATSTEQRIADLKESYELRLEDEARRAHEALQQAAENATRREAQLKEQFEQRLEQQRRAAEEGRQMLRTEFAELSNRALRQQSDQLSKDNADRMNILLDPFSTRLKELKERVEQVYTQETRERAGLAEHIKTLQEMNTRLSEEATNLSRALRADSKMQGNWGEMILERLLETSGLIKGKHYVAQEFLTDEHGKPIHHEETHKRMQPDVIVRYPGDHDIIIDSKVSLVAYIDYANAEEADQQHQALSQHLQSIRRHINELSQKDYSRYDTKSPDFVMMFIPNEGAYLTAIQHDQQLWHYAYERKVILMSPTNLISALRLANELWVREAQIQNVQDIISRATSLYEKVASYTQTFLKMGDYIKRTQAEYDKALGQLSTGRGNIIRQAEMLRQMGLTPKRTLPPELTRGNEDDEDDTDAS